MPEATRGVRLVVGASLAGLCGVESGCAASHTGPITLIDAEDHLPYNRPPLSKAFLTEPTPTLRPHPASGVAGRHGQLHDEWTVNTEFSTPAAGLDTPVREVQLADDRRIGYDKIIATGTTPKSLPDQTVLSGVVTLHPPGRADIPSTTGQHAARRGERRGFMGSEIAASVRSRALPTTIVDTASVPLKHVVGPDVGRALADTLRRHGGTVVRCGTNVNRLTGTTHVRGVDLVYGIDLPAFVIIDIGVKPAVEWLAGSPLALAPGLVISGRAARGRAAPAGGRSARSGRRSWG